MNYAKLAVALHALADVFSAEAGTLPGDGTQDEAAPAKGGKGKAKAAAASVQAAPAAAAAAPAAEPAPAPVPAITKDQLNKLVLKVAAKSRDAAEAILKRFGATNTVTLPQEQWQAVYDAFEEEIAKQDAAAVQVAQASLV